MTDEKAEAQIDLKSRDGAEVALFTLSKPYKMALSAVNADADNEAEFHGVGMRAFDERDLPLLDQFRGQPIALAQNVVAALCDLPIEHVRQLALEDFTMLADEALWQVSQVCCEMGLAPDFFVQSAPPPRDENSSRIIPRDPV